MRALRRRSGYLSINGQPFSTSMSASLIGHHCQAPCFLALVFNSRGSRFSTWSALRLRWPSQASVGQVRRASLWGCCLKCRFGSLAFRTAALRWPIGLSTNWAALVPNDYPFQCLNAFPHKIVELRQLTDTVGWCRFLKSVANLQQIEGGPGAEN